MFANPDAFSQTLGLVAIGHCITRKIKYWNETNKISLTPHLCFLFRLKSGDITESTVGFFEFNQAGVHDEYVNKFNYKWAPRLKDLEVLYEQWKGSTNQEINYTIGIGILILQVLCKQFKVPWSPMIQDFWLKEDGETWISRFIE